MASHIWFILIVCLPVLFFVLLPFFIGEGGILTEALTINSVDRLEKTQKLLLERYVQDEKAFSQGNISASSWQARKAYIVHRYIDAARRIDFLQGTK